MQNIPKIIHYCWFGKGEKNEVIKKCMESWKKYLPDYKIIEWNEDNFNINKNLYVKQAYESKKWAFVSDYVRLYAIYHYGGIYLDTDVEILKNIDIFLDNEAFLGYETNEFISTGIIGSKKGNELLRLLLLDYDKKTFINDDESYDCTTNVVQITKYIKENLKIELDGKYQKMKYGFNIYPKDYFSPKENGKLNITKNTYTIHHFNYSWGETKEERKKRKLKRRLKRYGAIIIFIIILLILKFYILK